MIMRTESEKAKAFDDKMAADARAFGRRDMLARHGMTEADLSPKKSLAERQADALATLPKSLAEAKGDARAFAKADMQRQAAAKHGTKPASTGRASMEAELRKMGMEPVR